MHTIGYFLDLAKEKHGLKSDRQLASALLLTSVSPYRKKSVIPDDMTAFKLAELCGLPGHEVLITCHLLKAAQGEHPETHGVWKDVLKMVVNSCIAFIFGAALLLSPAPAPAYAGAQSFTQQADDISIMRR